MRFPPVALAASLITIVIATAACGELKTANPGTDGGAGSSSASSSSSASGSSGAPTSGPTGPGPQGSLPSGYCCNDDRECRYRHCVAFGGGAQKVCEDSCRTPGKCKTRTMTFTCTSPSFGEDGWCEPETPAFTCIPAETFVRGTRQVGECCEQLRSLDNGEECGGNKCVAIMLSGQDNPTVCSQWCDSTKDCPSGTICGPLNECIPENWRAGYTCK